MRWLLPLAGWLLLCAAAPLPPLDAPVSIGLGSAVTLRYRLPETGLHLPGLPPLDGLHQLQPPRIENGLLTWQLLTVRPGVRRIPSLVLEDDRGRRWETAAFELAVSAPSLAESARPAALKPLPPPLATARFPVRIWLLAGLLLFWPLITCMRRRPQAETRDQRLARLASELPPFSPTETIEQTELRRLIEALRFAPAAPGGVDLDLLETKVRALRPAVGRRSA